MTENISTKILEIVFLVILGVMIFGVMANNSYATDVSTNQVVAQENESTDKGASLIAAALAVGLAAIGSGIAVAVVAVIAFIIASNPESSIMTLVSDAWAGFGAAFGPVVLLALFWKRSNAAGAMAGMISGALTIVIWDYIPMISGVGANGEPVLNTLGTSTGLYSLAVGFPVALVLMVVVSLCTKKPSNEIVREFELVKEVDV